MLSLAGCGLENIILLEPPVSSYLAGNDRFSFRATSANSEPEFIGFEVYYRIFAISGDSVPASFNTFEEMVAASFRRLYDPQWAPGDAGLTLPLIAPNAVDIGTDYEIAVSFNVADNIYPQVTSSGLSTEIDMQAARRAIPGLSEYKRFDRSGFSSGESDVTSLALQALQQVPAVEVRVVMFAISYGFDANTLSVVYSPPVWIGTEDFVIPDISG
jgi:hypothetical protein